MAAADECVNQQVEKLVWGFGCCWLLLAVGQLRGTRDRRATRGSMTGLAWLDAGDMGITDEPTGQRVFREPGS